MTGEHPGNRDELHFTKTYFNAAELELAVENYQWLATLGSAVRLPGIVEVRHQALVLERVIGTHVHPRDLVATAAHLGQLHTAAHQQWLHAANQSEDFTGVPFRSFPIRGFMSGRADAVVAAIASGRVPRPLFGAATALAHMERSLKGPAALYKDSNPRNFIVTIDEDRSAPFTVDFDDLTLAPAGYDLAKLTVGLAMTHGALAENHVSDAISAYNEATKLVFPGVTKTDFLVWAELHHILTSRYLGRAGYRYSWDALRPYGSVAESIQDSGRRQNPPTIPTPIRRQLDSPDPPGRELELFRARAYRFSDDPRVYAFAEATIDRYIRGNTPSPDVIDYVARSLESIRRCGAPLEFDEGLAEHEDIDIPEELQEREAWSYHHHLMSPPPDLVVAIVGAPRSGTSHLMNLLVRHGQFAHLTTASCWAWPTRNLADPNRLIFGLVSNRQAHDILTVDNRRTRLLPMLAMPGEAEDVFARAIPTYQHLGGHRYAISEPSLGQIGILNSSVSAHMNHFGSTAFLTKSPFNSFRIPILEQIWDNRVHYIHIVRERLAVAESMRRNGFEYRFGDVPSSAEDARDQFVQAVEDAAPNDRLFTVGFLEVSERPAEVLRRVTSWLGARLADVRAPT